MAQSRMFAHAIDCYQAIANSLSAAAGNIAWSTIVVNVELEGPQVTVMAACHLGDRSEPVAYLTEVPMLARGFYELAPLISTEDKGYFKKCSFVLQSSGKFKSDFAY